MEKGEKVLWVVIGCSALAGVMFLSGHVHADEPAREGEGAEGDEVDEHGRRRHAPSGGEPPLRDVDERTALARVIRSEAGSHTPDEKMAVAWVTRNRARKAGKSIAEMVCSPTCGPGGRARPMSSRQAPRASDFALADVVLASNSTDDPTHGAWNAFEPALQDKLQRTGTLGHVKTADQVRRDWLKTSDYYGTVGHWELYGPIIGAAPTPPRRPKQEGPRPTVASPNRTGAPEHNWNA